MRTKCCNPFVDPLSLASKLSVQVRGAHPPCPTNIETNVETVNLFFSQTSHASMSIKTSS